MAPGIACAPWVQTKTGPAISGGLTDGTADAQEVDVPSHDEQRVRNTHESRITCNEPDCPGTVRHVDGAGDRVRRHTRGNVPPAAPIPGTGPGRRPSALAEPAERGLPGRRSGR